MKDKLTYEAALIEINNCKYNGFAQVDWENRTKAIDLAMKAVRKQIPKKPMCEGTDEQDDYFCPSCKEPLCSIGDTIFWDMKPKYCEECGQALDWD